MEEKKVMRVLVVDDELGMREGCRRALTSHGFEVEVAESGPAGLAKLREFPCEILLVDAMMPGMSGIEMIQETRKLYPELIAIIITGYATVEFAVTAMREGAHDFIAKPFTASLLLQVINRELDRQHLKREAQRVKDLEEEVRGLARVKADMERLGTIEGRFMLTMVHILRAPVAVLQNFVQLIRKGYVPPAEQPALLENIEQRAGELLQILDEVLVLSRLKERLTNKPAAPVEVAAVLEGVLDLLEKEAEERGLAVSLEKNDCPTLWANEEHLRLLWTHLLQNAIRYTPLGGRVSLSLRTDRQQKTIIGTVSDSGIGIATEEIPRIFEEFYRTEAAKNMQASGTGLGLPIVQQIISLYEGALEINSAPGQGSSFRFTLPLTEHSPGALA